MAVSLLPLGCASRQGSVVRGWLRGEKGFKDRTFGLDPNGVPGFHRMEWWGWPLKISKPASIN